jgi:hypothetical protein
MGKALRLLSIRTFLGFVLALAGFHSHGFAQLNGFNIKGDMGSKAGSQAPEGMYVGAPFYWYDTSRINNRDGSQVNPGGSFDMFLGGPLFSWVTPYKFFRANYAFTVALPIANAALEAPVFGENPSPGLSDMYIQPINLGWHFPRADVTAGYGLFIPTGRYTAGANDNTGLGMWGNELSAGTTVFFDEEKKWHAATNAAFEFHTDKKSTTAHVGDLLTLEGGLGRDFLKGGVTMGAACYAQWKLTDDTFASKLPSLLVRGKNSAAAVGPELTLPIAFKKTLYGFYTFRYQWEVAAHTTTQGRGMNMMLVFPLKPIKIP